MKTFVTAAGMAIGASAAILPRTDGCCFQLTASGGVSGTLGQLDDGQNRVGGGLGEATYCINNGMITDGSGRGCILTPPTTQFQCDMGASPDGGFSIGSNGMLMHDGDDTFYACPADEKEYNIYTTPVDNQPKCEKVMLSTGGKCASGAATTSSAGKGQQTSSMMGNTCPPAQTVYKTETEQGKPTTVYKTETQQAKPTTVYKTETEQAKPTTVYKTETVQNTQYKPTTVYQTKTVEETETATKPTTVYETKTVQETMTAKPTTVYETKTEQQTVTNQTPTTVYKTKTVEETETATKPTTVYQTKTVQETMTAKPTTVYETKTEQQTVTNQTPTTVYKTKTVEETETATKPTTVYETKTQQQTVTAQQPTTVYQTKTVEETETAKKPVTQYVTKTEQGKASTITQYKTQVETQQAPAQTITKKEKYCPNTQGGGKPTQGSPTATKPAQTGGASACPTDLSGDYQYPHLIVPVNSDQPEKEYGTSYNGKMDMSTSSVFNFDIPQSYQGKTCSLVFLFPKQSELETSSFTFNNKGSISVDHLSSPAKQSTSFSSLPDVESHYGDISAMPGNSYVVHTGDCAAGTTQSYELSANGGLSLDYFQDYNPSPIGLYITTC